MISVTFQNAEEGGIRITSGNKINSISNKKNPDLTNFPIETTVILFGKNGKIERKQTLFS